MIHVYADEIKMRNQSFSSMITKLKESVSALREENAALKRSLNQVGTVTAGVYINHDPSRVPKKVTLTCSPMIPLLMCTFSLVTIS